MDFVKKHKSLIAAIIVLLFYFLFWNTARTILDEDAKEVTEKRSSEKVVEDVKPADVTLLIVDATPSNKVEIGRYEAKMENKDTVWDLMEHLRVNQALSYEIAEYKDFVEVTIVNGRESNSGFSSWNVYDDGEMVVDWMNRNLDDNNVYELRLELLES